MRRLLLAVAAWAAMASSARAETTRIVEGDVVYTESRWSSDRKAVVTHSVIRTDAGEEVRVRQLGGSAEGLRMVLMHAPAVLEEEGRRVQVELAGDGASPWRVRKVSAQRAQGTEHPFVRTITQDTRVPVYWKSGCAILHFQSDGTSHVEDEFAVMDQVLRRWRSEVQECSYFDLVAEGTTGGEVGFDGINLVVFREDEWCRPPVDGKDKECYDSDAAGLTTLVFVDDPESDRNGEIVDADIELNGVNFAVAVNGATSQPGNQCRADLANTFTHEVGHLMGLDHTCWANDGPRLNDDNGDEVPRCSDSLPAEILEATMYTFQACGETDKASPESDDVEGVCSIYPVADDPGECEPADIDPGGCCAVAGPDRGHPSRGQAFWVLLLAGLFVLSARRRQG